MWSPVFAGMATSASGLCPGVCRGEVVSSRSRMYKTCDELESVRISGQWKPLIVNAPNPVISSLHATLYCAIATEGDGACAVHSLLGEPCGCRNNNLYAAQARATVVSAFGPTAAAFRNRLHNDILFTDIIQEIDFSFVVNLTRQTSQSIDRQRIYLR